MAQNGSRPSRQPPILHGPEVFPERGWLLEPIMAYVRNGRVSLIYLPLRGPGLPSGSRMGELVGNLVSRELSYL